MPQTRYLPSRLDKAFQRASFADGNNLKALVATSLSNPDYVSYFDDFVGQTAGTWPASANWGYPATVGTNTEVIGISANAIGGELAVTTAATTNDSAYQYVGRHWKGTNGFYFICRAKLDRITNAKFEIGMGDSVTRDSAIATKATPTFNATDGAWFAFDTTDDTNITFITAKGGVAGSNADSVFAIAADTYFTLEIVAEGGQARGFVNGIEAGGTGLITAATALTPGVGCVTRTGSTSTLTVDYLGCFGPRFPL